MLYISIIICLINIFHTLVLASFCWY